MIYIAILLAGASLGLSGLVIVWGIAWAARPLMHMGEHKSVIPEVRPGANSSTYAVFLRSGQLHDSEV